jgi:hypothetical protein
MRAEQGHPLSPVERLTELEAGAPTIALIAYEQYAVGDQSTFDKLLWESVGDPADTAIDKQPIGIYRMSDNGEMHRYDERQVFYSDQGSVIVVRRDTREVPEPGQVQLDPGLFTVTSANLLSRTITDWPVKSVERRYDPHTQAYLGMRFILKDNHAITHMTGANEEALTDGGVETRTAAVSAHILAKRTAMSPEPFLELLYTSRSFSNDGVHSERLVGELDDLLAHLDMYKQEAYPLLNSQHELGSRAVQYTLQAEA